MDNNITVTGICHQLLQWFDEHGRTFFWRERCDLYTLLMAEILLKKTSADAVNRFLPIFLDSYGDIESLYEAPELELKHVLAPLGLASQRAKQMKELANFLVQFNNSDIPRSKEELLKLPGVGEYTAGALLSFSLGIPEAIVDTNVARIIIRIWGIKPSRCEARRSPEVWDKAIQLVNTQPKQAARINWALLDLGAMICRPKNPKHNDCPLKESCVFYMADVALPENKPISF